MNIDSFLHNRLYKHGIQLGLDRIRNTLNIMGNPHKNGQFIHIAGTNGKGSIAKYLSAAFSDAGYKTGLYTSPHLIHYNERFQINGHKIPNPTLARLLTTIVNIPNANELTEFEILTVTAFLYFSEKLCDVIILETGLGGRLDATNVVIPVLSILMPISLDHQDYLGNTLIEIAREKSGIIKPTIPVFTAPQAPEVISIIADIANQIQAPVYMASNDVQLDYVKENKRLTSQAISLLIPLFHKLNKNRCNEIIEKTTWIGRAEKLSNDPIIILDGAHNEDGMQAILQYIQIHYIDYNIVFILGTLQRKNVKAMLSLIFASSHVLWVTQYGIIGETLLEQYRELDPDKQIKAYCENIAEIFDRMSNYKKTKTVFVLTGSLYFVGKIKEYLHGRGGGI